MPDIDEEEIMDEATELATVSKYAKLVKEGNDITDKIMNASTTDELNEVTNLFLANQRKKDMIRSHKLSGLLGIIDDEVINRFASNPESFDHDQLLSYMNSTQRAIDSITRSLDEKPVVQINTQHNEINIDGSGLNRESRVKVLNAVQDILNSLQDGDVDDIINEARLNGGRVISVGTTSTRTLETVGTAQGLHRVYGTDADPSDIKLIQPASGWTNIFIYPGYEFKVVDSLITNFHLPESTLIMLVSAFYNRQSVLDAYAEAVKERYRFFSFGDSMFLE